jgi:hypothetical protein
MTLCATYSIQLEFNLINLNSNILNYNFIAFKFNWREKWMQVGAKVLKTWCNYGVVGKNLFWKYKFDKTPFHSSLFENQLNRFQFETTIQEDTKNE